MSSGESLARPGEGQGNGEHGPAPTASPDDAMSQFAGYVVNRLFSVGLSLESARSIVGEGPAGDRVAAATGEVDRMIRDIRTRLFDPVADRRSLAPGGHPDLIRELMDQVVNSISEVSALLQATAELPRDTAELRITQVRRSLDEVARKLRDHLLAGRGTPPGLGSRSPLGGQARA
jgi:hypothetical protein